MIDVDRLTKRYGSLTAIDEVSFTVGAGEVLHIARIGADQPPRAGQLHSKRSSTHEVGRVSVGEEW